MIIEFVKVDKSKNEHFDAMAKWANDESINYLFIPQFTCEPLRKYSAIELRDSYQECNDYFKYMIVVAGELVGDFSIDFDFKLLYLKEPSAWISITIGESKYQNTGIGNRVMKFIDEFVKSKGYSRIELGVFDFNQRAIKFYEKMGYTRIGKINDFTYYDGKWYQDYRYEKRL